jgi:MoaA/NifB/PqqE/SkfB family radical SAM enzyme
MIKFNEIRDIHLEISSLCNARCPICPRNFKGYPYNDGYTEANLTFNSCKHIFTSDLLKQLTRVWVNGNFGDAVMNPETPDIMEYFRSQNPELSLVVCTNGSARDKDFWQRLAKANVSVSFRIDGLEDTHHLYRQNTNWHTIIKNAQIFMDAGGTAKWDMIPFDHNLHQIESCRALAKELGFFNFELMDTGRDTGPVYNKYGKFTHILGKYQGETDFKKLIHKKKTDMVLLEDIIDDLIPYDTISCQTITEKSIYIDSTGDVYPCCFTGFSPKTYGHGEYYEVVNAQLSPLITNNNALLYTLEECIIWFNKVEESWEETKFESGKLIACNNNCGSCKVK